MERGKSRPFLGFDLSGATSECGKLDSIFTNEEIADICQLADVLDVFANACDAFGLTERPAASNFPFIVAKLVEASEVASTDTALTRAVKDVLHTSITQV